jgi:hypothetical protein
MARDGEDHARTDAYPDREPGGPRKAFAGLGRSAERADFAARFVRPKSKPALLFVTKGRPKVAHTGNKKEVRWSGLIFGL